MTRVPLRLSASSGPKLRRLGELLGGRDETAAGLPELVRDAQALGSLELAGYRLSWHEVRAAGRGEPSAEPACRLLGATRAVAAADPLDRRALLAWHAALTAGPGRFRETQSTPSDVPAPAPPAFIESRLALLEEWLVAPSGQALPPAQRAALVLARLAEVRPFDTANGRVARLAASHVAVQAGGRPPILVGGDRERLGACLQAAFRLEMEPLTTLFEEASERALDVMIQSLRAEGASGDSAAG